MFSLIVTVISIALVAALAVATLYGGSVFVSQQEKALIATLDNQMQQIYAASQAYYLDNSVWAANVAILTVDGHYLKTAPAPPGTAYAALQPSFGIGALGTAFAQNGGPGGVLPTLKRPVGDYLALAEGASALKADFVMTDEDAPVLRAQLAKLQLKNPDLPEMTLRIMEREMALQAAHKPSMLDYTWPAAAAQNARTRYLWMPSKVSKDVCRGVNRVQRGSNLIPDSYSAGNGLIQCFGTDVAGYSYLWLSPGADPAQVSLTGTSGGAVDACSNISGAQAVAPAGYLQVEGECLIPQSLAGGSDFPAAVTIPSVAIGGSRSVVVTGRNTSGGPLTYFFGTYEESGYAADPFFSIAENTCTGVVAAGATCSFRVTWAPTVIGQGVVWVDISDSDGGSRNVTVYSAATPADPAPAYTLVANLGQTTGIGFVFDNGRVNPRDPWGATAAADLDSADADAGATFCPTSPDAAAALATLETDTLGWVGVPSLNAAAHIVHTLSGTRCLAMQASTFQGIPLGTYAVEFVLAGGTFNSVIQVKAKPTPRVTGVSAPVNGRWYSANGSEWALPLEPVTLTGEHLDFLFSTWPTLILEYSWAGGTAGSGFLVGRVEIINPTTAIWTGLPSDGVAMGLPSNPWTVRGWLRSYGADPYAVTPLFDVPTKPFYCGAGTLDAANDRCDFNCPPGESYTPLGTCFPD